MAADTARSAVRVGSPVPLSKAAFLRASLAGRVAKSRTEKHSTRVALG